MVRKPNPERMVTVKTTFQPDKEIEMDRREAEDLARQGLIVGDLPAEKGAVKPVREKKES